MQTNEAHLVRHKTGDTGTFGVLYYPGIGMHMLELPWRDNKQFVSCIPAGEYVLKPHESPQHGSCYKIWTPEGEEPPGRYDCLIHAGNVAGDVYAGYASDSEGCILPGYGYGMVYGQEAVTHSVRALNALRDTFGSRTITLHIREVHNERTNA